MPRWSPADGGRSQLAPAITPPIAARRAAAALEPR